MKRCNRCESPVVKSDNPEYSYQCLECDEDLYSIEIHEDSNYPWSCTDSDCAQYQRRDGSIFEMIQAVWLDTTEEDIERGLHPYIVVKDEIDVHDLSDEEVLLDISPYGYSIVSLIETYGDADCSSCRPVI